MGSSESKMCASKQVKPEPAIKNMSHLLDPRSPSVSVDRTPIQVGYLSPVFHLNCVGSPVLSPFLVKYEDIEVG